MQIDLETVVTTKTTHTLVLTADLIREAFSLPADARVFFRVPTGGDWSGCDLDINRQNPVEAVWTTEVMQTSVEQRGM